MMNPIRILMSALMIVALAGCATTRSIVDGTPVEAGHGVLAFHVSTLTPRTLLQYDEFNEGTSFGYLLTHDIIGPAGTFRTERGQTYWVTPIKAGEYMWSRLFIDTEYATLTGSNRFTIKPGTITYVGHLTIGATQGIGHIRVEDKDRDMRTYLEEHFPKYAQTMKLEKSVTEFR